MKREEAGCLAMIIIPVFLATLVGAWWIVGSAVVIAVNYLAQRELLPATHFAYLCVGFLLSVISGSFKATIKRD